MAKVKINLSLIIILLLGLGLRLINLNQSFWLDEASQARMSSQPISWIWSGRGSDFHPPSFYILAHYWEQLSSSEWWLRLPSVIFGTVNIYVVYLLARRLFPGEKRKIWSLSALLFAINAFSIYYSQEFRSYALLCLLGSLAMYFLLVRRYWLLAVVNTLLVYTHYSAFFLLIAQWVYIVSYRKSDFKIYLSGFLVSLLLYLPWLPQLLSHLQAGADIDNYLPGWRSDLSVSALKIVPLTFFNLLAGRITFLSKYVYYPYMVFVLACLFAVFKLARVYRDFLFTWVLVPLLSMIACSFFIPQNQPFRVIYIIPGLVLLSTQACLKFPKLFLTFLIYIALVGNISYFTRPRLQREQWRQAINYLQSVATSQSEVVIKFSDRFSPFSWYAPRLPVLAAVPRFPGRPEDIARSLSPLMSKNRIFLLDYLGDLTDPQHFTDRTLLDLGFIKDRTLSVEGVGLIQVYFK